MANQKLNKNTAARQLARIQLVLEERARHHAVRVAARNQRAFMVGIEQLAAQYGVDPRQLLAVKAQDARANSATVAPSREAIVVGGESLRPCKAVHALCATIPDGSRKEMMQLCIDNGINRATAATQIGLYRKNNKMSAE
jgi:hypothetical protein